MREMFTIIQKSERESVENREVARIVLRCKSHVPPAIERNKEETVCRKKPRGN